jgi:hypothetical protein
MQVAFGSPLAAQDVEVINEPQEIILIGYLPWRGSADEVRRIKSVPVPKSFANCADRFEQGCAEQLLDWHLNYGTEASTRAALAEAERRIVAQQKLTATTGQQYRALLSLAKADMTRYLTDNQLNYMQFVEIDRRISATTYPAISRLAALGGQVREADKLAQVYAYAADWHRSPALLRKARYWREIIAPAEWQASLESRDADRALAASVDPYVDTFAELSLAVTQAAISRDVKSIEAADEASAKVWQSDFDEARRRRSDDNISSTLRAKIHMATEFAYYRYRITLLGKELGVDLRREDGKYLGEEDFRDMESLFDQHNNGEYLEYQFGRGRSRPNRVIASAIDQAETDLIVARKQCRARQDLEWDTVQLLAGALETLRPAVQPSIYARVGGLFLDLHSTMRKCIALDQRPHNQQDLDAQARIVRAVMASNTRR